MRIATGKVVDGRIEVAGEGFPEGRVVTVLMSEDGEGFMVGPEEEAALLSAIAEGDDGDVISADELLSGLGRKG